VAACLAPGGTADGGVEAGEAAQARDDGEAGRDQRRQRTGTGAEREQSCDDGRADSLAGEAGGGDEAAGGRGALAWGGADETDGMAPSMTTSAVPNDTAPIAQKRRGVGRPSVIARVKARGAEGFRPSRGLLF
jgi:hypothetical protein